MVLSLVSNLGEGDGMEFNKYLIVLVCEDIDRRVLIIWIMCLFLLVFMKEL